MAWTGAGADVDVAGVDLGFGVAAEAGARVGLAGGATDWVVTGFADAVDVSEAGLGSASPEKCSLSLPLMASRMKSIQMGRATRAPCSLSPRDWRLS